MDFVISVKDIIQLEIKRIVTKTQNSGIKK